MPRYRYTHEASTAFVTPFTWEPNLGDEIDLDVEVEHPYLQLVTKNKPEIKIEIEPEELPVVDVAQDNDAIDGDNDKEPLDGQ